MTHIRSERPVNLILGIESSCDDTSASIVNAKREVLSSIIIDQNSIHSKYGGVYPELAGRAHINNVIPAIKEALTQADVSLNDIDAIGVTRGPGLISSLLVGINAAAGMGKALNIPLIGVNHLRGHIRSAELDGETLTYPCLVLLVSGGHTLLAFLQTPIDIQILGSTKDDSVGEAYDKVARMLGYGFPGGPIIDKLAAKGHATIDFPKPILKQGLDFSFSGLKTAVSQTVQNNIKLTHEDIAASFVHSCIEVMMTKCDRALKATSAKSLAIVGGVSASRQVRDAAKDLCKDHNIKLHLPPLKWSTDNAAMIAAASFDYVENKIETNLTPVTRLSIQDW